MEEIRYSHKVINPWSWNFSTDPEKACDSICVKQDSRPQVTDLVAFCERQVSVISDPLYGDIQDRSTRAKEKLPIKAKPKSSGSSFATSVFTSAFQPTQQPKNSHF